MWWWTIYKHLIHYSGYCCVLQPHRYYSAISYRPQPLLRNFASTISENGNTAQRIGKYHERRGKYIWSFKRGKHAEFTSLSSRRKSRKRIGYQFGFRNFGRSKEDGGSTLAEELSDHQFDFPFEFPDEKGSKADTNRASVQLRTEIKMASLPVRNEVFRLRSENKDLRGQICDTRTELNKD